MSGHAGLISRARHIVTVAVIGIVSHFGKRYYGRRHFGKRYFG